MRAMQCNVSGMVQITNLLMLAQNALLFTSMECGEQRVKEFIVANLLLPLLILLKDHLITTVTVLIPTN